MREDKFALGREDFIYRPKQMQKDLSDKCFQKTEDIRD